MNTPAMNPRYRRLPLLAGVMAAVAISGFAIAALMISAHASNGEAAIAAPQEAASFVAEPNPNIYRCDECGVIESARKIDTPDDKTGVRAPGRAGTGMRAVIEAEPLRNYEITIRLPNGTMRVIRDAKPAHWRHGEPVTIIAGAD